MSNEFYIMATIVAVGFVIWLYKKGKQIVFWTRKISRTFKGIRINPKSLLNDQQCKKIAIGALYASQQGAYQNSMTTGIKDTLPEILGQWWGIWSTKDAHQELNYLLTKGFRYYYPYVLQAFALQDTKQQDVIFQQNMTSQEDYNKITSQFQNLQETYDELVSCGVVASQEDLQHFGVTGWDTGRACSLARACCEMGYLTEEEAWSYIDKANDLAHKEFISWKEFAMSYVIGRSLWGGRKAYNSIIKNRADELLSDEKSPWVRYSW